MTDFVRVEILFNSVEMELARRWAFHNVPPVFVRRPPMHLRKVVKAWWHLYHESTCARIQRNRLIWERNPAYPAEALDTSTLVRSLIRIRALLDVRALLTYRPLSQAERASVGLLLMLTAYYTSLQNEHDGKSCNIGSN